MAEHLTEASAEQFAEPMFERQFPQLAPRRTVPSRDFEPTVLRNSRTDANTMNDSWETDIGGLLAELADVQSALLETLHEKRQHPGDERSRRRWRRWPGASSSSSIGLQACHDRRQQLLGTGRRRRAAG